MIQVTEQDTGYVLGRKVFFGQGDTDLAIILRMEKGSAMRYDKQLAGQVDFPGDYDIQDVSITCIEADNVLSYVLTLDDERIALVQNVAVLDIARFDNIDTFLCMNDEVKTAVDSLEMQGDVVVLGQNVVVVNDNEESIEEHTEEESVEEDE